MTLAHPSVIKNKQVYQQTNNELRTKEIVELVEYTMFYSHFTHIATDIIDLGQPWKGCLQARWVKKGFYKLGFREKEQGTRNKGKIKNI